MVLMHIVIVCIVLIIAKWFIFKFGNQLTTWNCLKHYSDPKCNSSVYSISCITGETDFATMILLILELLIGFLRPN